MSELAFRLEKGADLRKSLEDRCQQYKVDTAIILCAVGCLNKINLRMAKAQDYLKKEADYEIISVTGTISNGKAHIHIGLSDENGNCVGGHLEQGCIVNTTCEVVLMILDKYHSERVYDSNTTYDEIVFEERNCND